MTAYCTREDIEQVFGAANVEKWADLDNDQADAATWVAETATALGAIVRPTESTGFMYEATALEGVAHVALMRAEKQMGRSVLVGDSLHAWFVVAVMEHMKFARIPMLKHPYQSIRRPRAAGPAPPAR